MTPRPSLSFALLVALSVLACASGKDRSTENGGAADSADNGGESGDSGGDSAGDSGGDSDGENGGSSGEGGAPQILSFGTNVSRLTQGETVVFTAVVTDPDGIDDLIGGTLADPGGATYGAFATASAEGSYEISLTWAEIDQVASIDFASSEARTFVGRFYDAGGADTQAEVSIELHCGGQTACSGACVNLETDERNCGECGNTCSAECNAGSCAGYSECVGMDAGTNESCQDVCGGTGGTCSTACGAVALSYNTSGECSEDLGADDLGVSCGEDIRLVDGGYVRCCCE